MKSGGCRRTTTSVFKALVNTGKVIWRNPVFALDCGAGGSKNMLDKCRNCGFEVDPCVNESHAGYCPRCGERESDGSRPVLATREELAGDAKRCSPGRILWQGTPW